MMNSRRHGGCVDTNTPIADLRSRAGSESVHIGEVHRVEIFYGVNARIWANPVSCSHITFFVGCSLLPPNRKSTGIRTIRTTPTLRGANQSSRTETHTPNPLLPLDLHYSIRNVHPVHQSIPVRTEFKKSHSSQSSIDFDASWSYNRRNTRAETTRCLWRLGRFIFRDN